MLSSAISARMRCSAGSGWPPAGVFTGAVPETPRRGPPGLDPRTPQKRRTATVIQFPTPSSGSALMSPNNLRFGDQDIASGHGRAKGHPKRRLQPPPIHLHLVKFRGLGRRRAALHEPVSAAAPRHQVGATRRRRRRVARWSRPSRGRPEGHRPSMVLPGRCPSATYWVAG